MSEDKNNTYVETNADIRTNILSGTYSLNQKTGRSRIWKYFVSIINDKGDEIPKKVCCILCYTVLSFNSKTTSNLVRHKCCQAENNSGREAKPVFKTIPLAIRYNNTKERILSKAKRIKNKKIASHYVQENAKIRYKILKGSFKLRKVLAKSKVWNIFSKIEDTEGNEIPTKVCCQICYSVLNQNPKCASNLVRHKCYVEYTISDTTNNEKRSISSRLREEDEEDEMLIQELEKSVMELEEVPETKQEFIKISSINNSTYDDVKAEAVKIFSQWCIENFRPFDLAQDTGLRRFIQFVISTTANYGTTISIDNLLPDPSAISQNIGTQFNVIFEELRNEIELDCKYGYGLTSKLWIDKCWQQKYITLTIHYVNNGQLISKLLGFNVIDNEEIINNVLGIKIHEILSNYNFTYKDSIIVLDGDYNMTSALKTFNHINCINHILNNVIEKAIQEVEEINELYCQCLKIKKYFTDFNTNCDLSAIFKSFCLAKWNVAYYLLDAIEKNWLEIENILQQNSESQKIKNIEKKHLENVLRILKPFEHACKILEGEKYPTIHLVYAYVNGLKDSCVTSDEDENNNIIRQFKEILIEQLQTTVISKFNITHKIALFLFPPANKLTQFSEIEKNLIKAKIISYLKPYVQNGNKKDITKEPCKSSSSNTMISSYFKNFVTPPKSSDNCDEISSEIEVYESLNVPYDDNFDILQWWHLRQAQFPLLYILSCKILAAPASCASSERIFSIVRYLAKNNTNIISNSKIFNQLIFLNFNRDKNSDSKECLIGEKPTIEYEIIEEKPEKII